MNYELDALGIPQNVGVTSKVVHENPPRFVTGLPKVHVGVFESLLHNLEEIVDGVHTALWNMQCVAHQSDSTVPSLLSL